MKTMKKDLLTVNIYDTRTEMGKAAAKDIKACILSLLEKKETINMIFAAAPSQNEVLAFLAADRGPGNSNAVGNKTWSPCLVLLKV